MDSGCSIGTQQAWHHQAATQDPSYAKLLPTGHLERCLKIISIFNYLFTFLKHCQGSARVIDSCMFQNSGNGLCLLGAFCQERPWPKRSKVLGRIPKPPCSLISGNPSQSSPINWFGGFCHASRAHFLLIGILLIFDREFCNLRGMKFSPKEIWESMQFLEFLSSWLEGALKEKGPCTHPSPSIWQTH